jgi:hypothetical protein
MRRMALGFVLTFAALVLMISPALAVGSRPAAPVLSAADQEFLASLATPAPTLAAKRPIAEKALCSAAVDCGGGHSISCSSSINRAHCSSVDRDCPAGQQGSVTCDGVTTTCLPCPVASLCATLSEQCTESCGPCGVRFFQCDPYVCQCNVCD